RPVGGVDEGGPAAGEVLAGGMVPEIGGEEGVGSGGGRVGEVRVARTAAHRHGAHGPVGVAGAAHAPGGGGQGPRGALHQLGEAEGVDAADPADAPARAFVLGAVEGPQRAQVGPAEPLGQGVGDAGGGDVGVGVGDVEADVAFDEGVEEVAFVVGGGVEAGDAAQEQRMVGDDEVTAAVEGFGDALGDDVDGAQGSPD